MNKVRCARCGDIFTTADLNELRNAPEPLRKTAGSGSAAPCASCGAGWSRLRRRRRDCYEMGETYYLEKGCFLCPDCWDMFQQMHLEEQARAAILGIGKTESTTRRI